MFSPAGPRGRLSILIFHRVLPAPDPLFPDTPDVEGFERRMRWVRDWFNVLPLAEAVERLYAGTLPSRALCVTFDDGYADNEEHAAPILARLGLTGTFFISTGYLNGGCMWNDRVIEAVRACREAQLDLRPVGLGTHSMASPKERSQAIGAVLKAIKHHEGPQRLAMTEAIERAADAPPAPPLMMQEAQVRSLRRMGMEVGAHTISHPILTRLSPAAAFDEMRGGQQRLQEILDEPVTLFAYPNGVPNQDYTAEHARMARDCGFVAAVSTAWGAASARSDRYQMPRFSPWDETRWRYGARLLDNLRRVEAVAA
jgi:peptidoglycan/xylan/chitin deacetylase (PgdA/CDA1 family)